MPLGPDDTVCFCFDVSLRKVETFCRARRPQAASQISECLSAGTGCGWCVPMLRKVHGQLCGQYRPTWRRDDDSGPAGDYHSAERDAAAAQVDADAYAAGRKKYLDETKRTPPPPPAAAP